MLICFFSIDPDLRRLRWSHRRCFSFIICVHLQLTILDAELSKIIEPLHHLKLFNISILTLQIDETFKLCCIPSCLLNIFQLSTQCIKLLNLVLMLVFRCRTTHLKCTLHHQLLRVSTFGKVLVMLVVILSSILALSGAHHHSPAWLELRTIHTTDGVALISTGTIHDALG